MKKSLLPLFLTAIVLLFYGCASKQVSTPLSERIAQEQAASQPPSEEGAGLTGKEGGIGEEELGRGQKQAAQGAEAEAAAHLKDIYFEFDSYAIRQDDVPALKGMAGWLANSKAVKIVIEGHCDERGTTEYNLALGQKRAEAARDYLVQSGVDAARIRAISYGKEMPVDPAHTEEAWAKNRRDHFAIER